MGEVYNSGTVQYGSRVLSINSVNYIADNIEVTRPTNVIERNDQINEANGWVAVPGHVTGTATLQLATGSTAIPVLGNTFSTTIGGATAETFVIVELSAPEDKASEKKINISFRK